MDDAPALPPAWRDELGEALSDIARWRMPFGKYGPKHHPPRGVPLCELPAEYVMWFHHNGYPKGRLGELLKLLCEIHMAGAAQILKPLRQGQAN